GQPLKEPYPLRAPVPVGKRVNQLYRDRTVNFYSSGQWEKVNLLSFSHGVDRMMHLAVRSERPHLKLSVWSSPGLTRPAFSEAIIEDNDYRPARVGESFGPSWSTHWFRVQIVVPEDMRQMEHLELHWDCSNEATVWNDQGEPLQGLTGRGERIEWIIPESFKDGDEHTIFIEMACNGIFGNAAGDPIFKNNPNGDAIQPPDPNKFFLLSKAEIVAVDLQARMLHIDMQIIHQAAQELPEDSWEQHEALNTASRIINAFKIADRDSIVRGRMIAEEYLGPDVNSEKVFTISGGNGASVFAIGHCHIDTCWLWPWEETRRKVVRSWSNQCDLMDRYPELNFVCSQAQQFKWLKEGYPYAWKRVKDKVAAGQFHPIGGCWFEHDTNMPSGESLIRQFLFGQRFFESSLGFRSTTCWLPDTFGQSSQIPQLCRHAGMSRFLTQKICFNNINDFPHTTFNWVALDGSQVIRHMPPAKTYCADANFGDVKRSMAQNRSLDRDRTSLLVVSFMDNQGMILGKVTAEAALPGNRLEGYEDSGDSLTRPGSSTSHLGSPPDHFFARLEAKAHTLPTWHGELYFELHRGVYTTQAQTKLNNRRAGVLLRDIELLATFASIQDKCYRYPKKELDMLWEGVLLCQFHDCLPGTAIGMCYNDSDQVYSEVFSTGKSLLGSIYTSLNLRDASAELSTNETISALNTLMWPQREVVALGDGINMIFQGDGNILRAQKPILGDHENLVCLQVAKPSPIHYRRKRLHHITIRPASQTKVFHLDTREEIHSSSTSILEDTPLRVTVVTETRISKNSSIRTTISLPAAFDGNESQSLVECTAEVNWHETMKFLKVEFPVDLGYEVCCRKYADLSEYGYGVSILNDSKYGFATVGSTVRLSLLCSPKAPDDKADMGKHTIRWAILPHQGSLGSETVRAAFDFNNPLKLVSLSSESPLSTVPITLTGDRNLVLDTVKRGEEDEDVSLEEPPVQNSRSIIIRIYESLGGRGRAEVSTVWILRNVYETNVLEDDLEEVIINDGGFEVELGSFQLQTYRLLIDT
ncbi:Alpha-mannosidase 2, partial [Colletotrichum chlorophyti]